MPAINEHIGKRLKEQRALKGFSQQELAVDLGVTKAYISSIENGKRNPSVKVIEKFLDALGVDVFDFFNQGSREAFQYSQYQESFIKGILKNNEDWYSADSGFWGKRFFEECKDVISSQRTQKEVAIISRFIRDQTKRIFDAPCGYGRIANRLAKKGFNVLGIDSNQYFIDMARTEASRLGVSAKFIEGDIMALDGKQKFDVVLNIFTSIGYYETEEQNERFLAKLCGLVKKRGLFIIETVNTIGVLANYKPIEKNIARSGMTRVYERFFDVMTSTNVEKTTLIAANGQVQEKSLHCVRLYYPHELIKLCRLNGLKIVDILDSDGNHDEAVTSNRMWLIFEKID